MEFGILTIIELIGGLALFLFGMNVLSDSLERMAGGKLEQILRKLTSNPFKGLLLGIVVTAIIQSSSATTVMLVGLVNSGIMQLTQAIHVAMGSAIGTTVTAWLLSLTGIEGDALWIQLLKPANFSPIIAFIGILLIMVGKSPKKKDAGTVCLGFAILMYGMEFMSGAVEPLAEMEKFRSILTAFSNPILGVLVGMVFTAVIQSSSASVGVLQSLSKTGVITYGAAIPIIMGQNIGTCISAMIASIGSGKNARAVAVAHLLFKCIGTVVWLTVWCIADGIVDFAFAGQAATPVMVAIIHTIFNVLTTVMLFPFSKALEKISCKLVRDTKKGAEEEAVLLDERIMNVPAVAVGKALDASVSMAKIANDSILSALSLLKSYHKDTARKVSEMETELDQYEDRLGTYLVKLSSYQVSDDDSRKISMLLHSINDLERIGDHAINLLHVAEEMHDKNLSFSQEAHEELRKLTAALQEILSITVEAFAQQSPELASSVEPLEQVIDALISEIKSRHVARLRSGNCTIELGFVLTDLLTNCERVSYHCSNIAVALIETAHGSFDTHAYLNRLKEHPTERFEQQYNKWLEEYSL